MFGPIFTHVRFLSSVQYPVPDYYGQKGIALQENLIFFLRIYFYTYSFHQKTCLYNNGIQNNRQLVI